MATPSENPVTQLGWHELSERTWAELVDRGLPAHLADLGVDRSERNERRIRLYTLPTVQAGIRSLTVPFVGDDGILFDPSLLDHAGDIATEVARGLAYMLYPGWEDLRAQRYDEMNTFAVALDRCC